MTNSASRMRHEWQLSLTLLSPFTTGGTENAERGVDDAQLRDQDGTPLFAGSHLHGLFRHFLNDVHRAEKEILLKEEEKLVPRNVFFDWFGRPAKQMHNAEELEDGADYDDEIGQPGLVEENSRGRLTFRDLALQSQLPGKRSDRDRIRINRDRRSVAPGGWLSSEQIFPTGASAKYAAANGSAVVLYGTEEEAAMLEAAFSIFVESLPSIGGEKGAGFGKVDSLASKKRSTLPLAIPQAGKKVEAGSTIPCSFRLAQPLLVDPRLMSGNLHRSSIDIPGATLKAALAEFARMSCPRADVFDREFGSVLERIVIRHAHCMPAGTGHRRRTCPFSVAGGSRAEAAEMFVDAFTPGDGALRLAVNFKPEHRDSLTRYYDVFAGGPELLTRTRTAIKRHEFTADPHKLFNYQAVSPLGRDWITEFIIPEDFESGELVLVGRLLALLESGVVQIGKLRSDIVNVSFGSASGYRSAQPVCDQSGEDAPKQWRIKIDTPAYLLGMEQIEALHHGAELAEVYADRFAEIVNAENTIAADAVDWRRFDFLVQHQWSGGHRAVRYKQQEDGGYYPYLLTQPGSVFMLTEVPGAQAADLNALEQVLSGFAALGLPAARRDATWRNCPFVPENGYGEVTIDDFDADFARRGLRVAANA